MLFSGALLSKRDSTGLISIQSLVCCFFIMTLILAKDHINQFNCTKKLLSNYLKDGHLDKTEVKDLRSKKLDEPIQALVEDVISSKSQKDVFNANFRGALPQGYDAGDFFLNGDSLHPKAGISDRVTLNDFQSGVSQ
ncbi:MAG TPA: hypothetical protein V6C57_08425, partial [Coleofasciculaceae cyanobacterium]